MIDQRTVLTSLLVVSALALAVLAQSSAGWSAAPVRGAVEAERVAQATPVPVAPAGETGVVPRTRTEIDLTFAPLVKSTAPAVVNVYAARRVASRSPFIGDPFFEQFFNQGEGAARPRIESSLGSGVIVGASGLVVTNNHVIEGADQVRVALSDGREFDSAILLRDDRADLAVLKIQSDEVFPTVPIADSDVIEIGDLVLAIGNPFGIGQTVTSGIVSAVARTHIGVNDFGYFIQTDAAINPGNSGGALIDMRGQLVGVNTAIFSRSGGSNGIGFAIPSNMVRVFVEAAERGGRFERPFIGATFMPVTTDIADAVGLPRPVGALVQSVAAEAPAFQAGLKAGDVVLSMDGFAIDNPDALGYRLATAGLGRTAVLDVLSNDGRKSLDLRLDPAPETPPRDERRLGGNTPFSGSTVANLSPRLADELEMPQTDGVVVSDVEVGSIAMRLGLKTKDVVTALNGQAVASSADLEAMLQEESDGWHFEIDRNGQRLVQTVR